MIKNVSRIETFKVEVENGFYVLVVPQGNEVYDFILFKERDGRSLHMFGVEIPATETLPDEIVEYVEGNVEDYIEEWMDEYGFYERG